MKSPYQPHSQHANMNEYTSDLRAVMTSDVSWSEITNARTTHKEQKFSLGPANSLQQSKIVRRPQKWAETVSLQHTNSCNRSKAHATMLHNLRDVKTSYGRIK
jgi:hypothetical protein